MDHHRRVLGVVGAGVDQLEAPGHVVVELDGSELPRTTERIGHVDVDLRSVEDSLALGDVVGETVALQRARERRLGQIP